MSADPTRSWKPKDALAYATGRLTDPGPEAQNYSNSNYLLLGMLIENDTGPDYAAAVHRDVLAGSDSRFAVQDAEAPIPPQAAPELTSTGSHYLPNRATATTSGAAGIAADAPALALWGYRLYGGQILAPAITTELSTPPITGGGYGLGTKIWQPEHGSTLAATTAIPPARAAPSPSTPRLKCPSPFSPSAESTPTPSSWTSSPPHREAVRYRETAGTNGTLI